MTATQAGRSSLYASAILSRSKRCNPCRTLRSGARGKTTLIERCASPASRRCRKPAAPSSATSRQSACPPRPGQSPRLRRADARPSTCSVSPRRWIRHWPVLLRSRSPRARRASTGYGCLAATLSCSRADNSATYARSVAGDRWPESSRTTPSGSSRWRGRAHPGASVNIYAELTTSTSRCREIRSRMTAPRAGAAGL